MATSTLHLNSSIVGRWGSFRDAAASRTARLQIQRDVTQESYCLHEWHLNAIHNSIIVMKSMHKSSVTDGIYDSTVIKDMPLRLNRV